MHSFPEVYHAAHSACRKQELLKHYGTAAALGPVPESLQANAPVSAGSRNASGSPDVNALLALLPEESQASRHTPLHVALERADINKLQILAHGPFLCARHIFRLNSTFGGLKQVLPAHKRTCHPYSMCMSAGNAAIARNIITRFAGGAQAVPELEVRGCGQRAQPARRRHLRLGAPRAQR